MIWLIGNNGMLGTEVEALLKDEGGGYCVSDREVDITDAHALRRFAADKKISWIVNCSAYTAVDRAEDEPEKAFAVNAVGVGNIAHIAREKKATFIHVSTDYVFDGTKKGAYLEDDEPNPIGVYGKSKLEGERRVRSEIAAHFIIRTAWLYGKNGANFVHTMLRLFAERGEVRVVNDQWGSPTRAADLAGAIMAIIKSGSAAYGVYHYTGEGRISWHEFATAIYECARRDGIISNTVSIVPIAASEYPTKARRPGNSYLSTEKIRRVPGVAVRHWHEALEEYLREYRRRMN